MCYEPMLKWVFYGCVQFEQKYKYLGCALYLCLSGFFLGCVQFDHTYKCSGSAINLCLSGYFMVALRLNISTSVQDVL